MIRTRIIADESEPLDVRLCDRNLLAIRRAFSELMDAAMAVARSQGLDHDDVIVDRVIWMQAVADDEPMAVGGITLGDSTGWLDAFNRLRELSGFPAVRASAVRVVGLTLRALDETDAPLWEGARPDRNL